MTARALHAQNSLSAFLLSCLADDEAAAIEAGGQPWRVDGRSVLTGTSPADVVIHDEAGLPNDGEAAHIARHDPARVLANVAALRAVIAIHSGTEKWSAHICEDSAVYDDEDCLTLRALAQPYRDQPGWQEAWNAS